VAAECTRCKVQLRVIDNLQPAEVGQFFRGTISDSFVVVPTSDPQQFIEGSMRLPDRERQAQIPSLDVVARIEKIMALASGQSETDHPVCAGCLQEVVTEIQRQVDQTEEERRIYQEANARLEEELRHGSLDEIARLEEEVVGLAAEEREIMATLAACDVEEAQLEEELESQRRQEEQLKKEEDDFWLVFAEFQVDMEETEEERAATTNAIRYATAELARLKRTNVLNDMFHIALDGEFGTISQFRLGRLPDHPVPWDEINAAWGQACLLLDALVKRCSAPVTRHRLMPRGSYSAIQTDGEVLELHSTGGGRFFNDRHFDLAMVAFVTCHADLVRWLSDAKLPFKIEGDKVGGFSVRLQFNSDEKWTRALRCMLCNLKWTIGLIESR